MRKCPNLCFKPSWVFLEAIAITLIFVNQTFAQTASTCALVGVVQDPSQAVIRTAQVRIVNLGTQETKSTTSDESGRFSFVLLAPGSYEVQANKTGFAPLRTPAITLTVTETRRLELHLSLASSVGDVRVSAETSVVETDNSALGRVFNETALTSLPLATRNFAQIASLSPGVVAGVYNAGELGIGGTALSQIANSNDGIFVHGARSYENNWQLDGISVSDVQGSGAGSGGIPLPSPDVIQEFKIQTALYDAAYGRYSGANVSVITKSGTNEYHGTAFEFFRNDVLDANDYFRNETGQPRAPLKQNQFGFVFGGPIKKDRLLFLVSYQGTRQVNGLAAGQARIACAATLNLPPLTNDRSASALGKLFGGMAGAFGGVAVKADGSNINPVALALLNFKLPNGTYLIPTPQTVDTSKPFVDQGFSTFAEPCYFGEDQFSTNVDYLASEKGKITARFFFANDNRTVTFPGNFFNPVSNVRGFSSPGNAEYRVFSLAHTYAIGSGSLNEARMGYVSTTSRTASTAPFKWSDIGVTESDMSGENAMPNLNILGSVAFASAFPLNFAQKSLVFSDVFGFDRGAHTLRLGGSLTRLEDNISIVGFGSFVQFLSWPDFLLGLNATANQTGTFSNVSASSDGFGLYDREYRVWEGSAFAQDDYRIRKSLTLNIGIRYERLGQFGDTLGRNSSFDPQMANPNPPPAGSLAGYIVASNFHGTVPSGVLRADNTFANDGDGQNTIAPRIGFAWQVFPSTSRLALRGGYGLYFSRPTGQAFFQNISGPPFSIARSLTGLPNAGATFQSPFPQPFPTSASFPSFPSYSPTTATTIDTVAANFRPAMAQVFSLNLQAEVHDGWLLEMGYVGTRGTHLQRLRSFNQALDASMADPIRGVTSDTLANIGLRVPILGIPADSLQLVETEGNSWYNGLEVSLTARFKHDLQLLASYTFSKTLDTDGADINRGGSGIALTLGDQNDPKQRWGRASFDRTHRFILSATWSIPSPPHGLGRSILGQWTLGVISTIQSGNALTIADTNFSNVFGISEDRAQLTGRCTKNELVNGGSIESKLNAYFTTSCFTTPPVISADGMGTGFGNSGTGIVDGPGQANFDIAIARTIRINWPADNSAFQFRAEVFNALNHPQFRNPDSNFSSPTFGVINSTSVNARVMQMAIKFAF